MAQKKGNKGQKKGFKPRSIKKGSGVPKGKKMAGKGKGRNIHLGVEKYNKIVHVLVKDYKKRGIEYNIREVQKRASGIYPNFQKVAYSRITNKSILKATPKPLTKDQRGYKKATFRILAQDVPKSEFDEVNFWELAEVIPEFSRTYPEIPIIVRFKHESKGSKLVKYGSIGTISKYEGSKLQDFIEEIRGQIGDDYEKYTFTGTPAWQKSEKKQFAFWGTSVVKFPRTTPKVDKITPETKKEIEIRKKLEEERKRKAKTLLPKKIKEEKEGDKKVKKITEAKGRELTKQMEILREAYKEGVYTKKEYKDRLDKIINRYGSGGLI